ncbi:MAG: paraquat-inducible protein A [Gammaproteobacteria bacterium]|nr:MAG: paraquat-inducible protein A [Gammaproteobacteria bacterium]
MSLAGEQKLIACHECDHLYRVSPVPEGGRACCTQCGAVLYRNISNSIDRTLALFLSALVLMIIANSFPFISLEISGRVETNALVAGAWEMHKAGMGELGLLVFLTSVFFPLLVIVGMIYLLLPIRLGFQPPAKGAVYRIIKALIPWSLVGVFLLGIVKLLDLADVIPGISMFALAGLMVVYAAARTNWEPSSIWPHTSAENLQLKGNAKTAYEHGLIHCHTCGLLVPQSTLKDHSHASCPRCDSPLHFRKNNSLARTWALVLTAAVLIIPANVYPIMTVIRFGQGEPDTIYSGITHLIESGMWGLALIVFFASIVVPVLKLIVLTLLLITVQKRSTWRVKDRTLLYRATEVVGAWSMVDIFLVALLSALVSLDALATIRPGIGAVYFACVVVITMIAAHTFDPRLIWDNSGGQND